MKEKDTYVIHDKPASLLMILTFTLTFFIVIRGIQLQNAQNEAAEQMEKEQYKTYYRYTYSMGEERAIQRFRGFETETLELEKGNVILSDYDFCIGDAMIKMNADVVLKQTEPYPEMIEEGHFPTEAERVHHRSCVVIGCGLLMYTQQQEKNRRLVVDGKSYEVIGILKDITGSGADDRLFLFYDCMERQEQREIDRRLMEGEFAEFTVSYGSNGIGVEESFAELADWLYQIGDKQYYTVSEEYTEQESGEGEVMSYVVAQVNRGIVSVLFAFCLCACYMVSSVWIKRKKKELVVRKALGGTFGGISVVLLKDICVMVGISVFLDVIFWGFRMVVTQDNWLKWKYMGDNICHLGLSAAAVVAASMVWPFYTVLHTTPAEGMRSL